MNYQQLQTELENPLYEGKTATECAELLNAPTVNYFIEPPTPDATNFMFNNGMYMKLLGAYRDHPVAQIRIAAEAALDLAQSQIANVNLQNPNTQQLMGALVTGGVWTQEDADSLLAFATRTASRAESEFGRTLSETDINRARLGDKEAQLVALLEAHHQRGAVLNALLSDVQSGVDVDLSGVE